MRRGFLLLIAISLAIPALALADPPAPTVVEMTLAPDLLPQQVLGDDAFIEVGVCGMRYRNQLSYQSFLQQKGFEILDDLHTNAHGYEALCAYEIGFYNLSGGHTDAYVTIYDNDAADSAPGKVLAGPFYIPNLPGGLVRATFFPETGVIDEDVWMGVKFGAFKGTGLTVADPVMVGVSHDIAYSFRDGYVNFGGPPALPANFVLAATAQIPVPNQVSTWGRFKDIYR
jgi:hypothetical protein